MINTLKNILPASMRQWLLAAMRKPMSAYLRSVEAEIPKHPLSAKHLTHTRILADRLALLKQMPTGGVVAELGVDQGDFSAQILDICQPLKLHLVDFWGSKRYNQEKQKAVFKKFDALIKQGKVEINLGLSTDVVDQFADHYFDWIYIDTDHTYQTTKQELEKYRLKMKPGGIIAGHDYCIGSWVEMRRYGVIEAVHEFCDAYQWEIIYLTIETGFPQSFAIRAMNDYT